MPGQHICNDNVSVKANGRNANGYFVIMLQVTRWLVLARDTLWFRGQGAHILFPLNANRLFDYAVAGGKTNDII